MLVEVILLDGSACQVEVSSKANGDELLEQVTKSINLAEKDYFGLTYQVQVCSLLQYSDCSVLCRTARSGGEPPVGSGYRMTANSTNS